MSAQVSRGARHRIPVASFVLLAAVAMLAGACGILKDNSYEGRAADIVNTHMDRLDKLSSDAEPDIQRCSGGATEACDLVMTSLSQMADEIHGASAELSRLTPSSKASSWHQDYLALLDDAEALVRQVVSDWNDGDASAMARDLDAFSGITSREDELVAYFNDKLR